MTATKRLPRKPPPAKRQRVPRKPAHDASPMDAALLYADGLSAPEISVKLDTPIRTVYDWLKRDDVRERIEEELDFRDRYRRRDFQRNVRLAHDQALAIMQGKIIPKSREHADLIEMSLRYYLGIEERGEEASKADGLIHGPIQVNVISAPQGEPPPLGSVYLPRSTVIED